MLYSLYTFVQKFRMSICQDINIYIKNALSCATHHLERLKNYLDAANSEVPHRLSGFFKMILSRNEQTPKSDNQVISQRDKQN